MGDDEAVTIGQRVRRYRTSQGMSLDDLAERAGLSKSFLSRAERGERRLDRRTHLDALADALGVSLSNLIGQPYRPTKQRDAQAHGAVLAVRVALMDTAYGERPEIEAVRPVLLLGREVWRVERLCEESDYAAFGSLLPDLLTELHAATADPDGVGARGGGSAADPGLPVVFYLLKDLGYADFAWIAADRASVAADASERPELLGLAQLLLSHALRAVGARSRALATANRAADALQPAADDGPADEVYGMLHLTSALSSVAGRRQDDADRHLDEVAEVAGRPGDGNTFKLHFGQVNVGIWHVAVAVEAGMGGKVAELVRGVALDTVPSRGRRAAFWSDVARGLVREPNRQDEARAMIRPADEEDEPVAASQSMRPASRTCNIHNWHCGAHPQACEPPSPWGDVLGRRAAGVAVERLSRRRRKLCSGGTSSHAARLRRKPWCALTNPCAAPAGTRGLTSTTLFGW